ncbi:MULTISPECIES: sensor domain-containing diguanylate cyclase [Pseudoalteromonas]|uniref:diguanylate cyclase n=1 Tax=Pseudoalteromonas luteoviolacea (strain 2ta16) TaxID=1353533 RepID=V4JBT0_PSEL2|nr:MULTISPECIES: sensor domain-containing diguanylate cyclase [Pseudoalteromonas]ESP92587.1 diguanylate cyclase (GGDEF) domain protein [Pseudoalteromonas luteoviolacea 2ta16]KZN40378.1 hypothetical protein N483_17650 [Pseudoalteromonas luteoviolacea NCIMB 1944]MCG7550519.1 sensor domain-containing diguanylate cyclase [Pseudoalteromonas sp. Of7M-16]
MSSSINHESICLPITFVNELSKSKDLPETLDLISHWLPQIIDADRASVCLHNGQEDTLEVYALYGNKAIEANTILQINNTMVGRVFQSKTLEINNNLKESQDFDCKILHGGGLNSCMDVPLQKSGACFGTLNLGSLRENAYQTQHAVLLECIANWLANYLHAQMEITEQKKRAETDPLTKASNRRCLTIVGNELLSKWQSDKQPFAMIMMDIDNFKQFNDRYGHNVGDLVLVTFSKVINQVIRTYDHFFRVGGDEFVILVSGNVDVAGKLAERIRLEVAGMTVQYDIHSLHITISCGVTTAQLKDDNLESIYNRADQALYLSKKNGRDRTTIN